MRTFHHDQDRQFPPAEQVRGVRLVGLSKIAHRDAEVLEADPDNEAHHTRTWLRFLRKFHRRRRRPQSPSPADADKIVQAALHAFGRVDIRVAMTQNSWSA